MKTIEQKKRAIVMHKYRVKKSSFYLSVESVEYFCWLQICKNTYPRVFDYMDSMGVSRAHGIREFKRINGVGAKEVMKKFIIDFVNDKEDCSDEDVARLIGNNHVYNVRRIRGTKKSRKE